MSSQQARADVIVIGAGIVGSACAHELARRGLDVLVLDDRRGGATAVGMGHLVAMDDNPAELALSGWSLELWRQLAPSLDAGSAYRACGTLWLAADAEELAAAEAKQATLAGHGIACELLGAAALRAAEPALREGLVGALRVGGDGILYAPNAARGLLEQGGARIVRRQARVTQLCGNHLCLDDGRWLKADAVILANGIHAAELCPGLPLRPKKGHLLITDRYPARIQHQLVELGYVTSAHASEGTSVAFNAQPRPTGQIFLGSSRQFDTLDPRVEGPVLARMLRRALDYLPGLAGMNAIRSWTGFRAASPDGLPLLGAHPEQPGLWLAVGHEGLGVTTAPASARLLAAQLFGETAPLDPAPYRPQRFTLAATAVPTCEARP
ncbi:FAD-binding oxidoreductase [Pseudomonas alcaligenes]|uniref:NAD(P)/FAD-dependent oxidoreductase n=1 Tax=Pseudomonas sp. RIT-PI-AD TaxID=3035294 RepID=UPI0021DAE1AC